MNEKQIQEVMALVDEFGDSRRRQGNDEYSPESVNRRYAAQYGKDADELRSAVESALREQVREVPTSAISGALFDFAGYLTTLDKSVTFGSYEDASPMVEHIQTWAEKRGLYLDNADVQNWTSALSAAPTQPAQVSQPKAAQQEPFGWWKQGETLDESDFYPASDFPDHAGCETCIPLYTAAAPQREPMTDEQAFKSWKALREMKPSINAMSAFQAGIDLAERFHHITKKEQQ